MRSHRIAVALSAVTLSLMGGGLRGLGGDRPVLRHHMGKRSEDRAAEQRGPCHQCPHRAS